MKENRCRIKFECLDWCDCVYRKGYRCNYMITPSFECTSKVAQANAMVLEMKEMGIEFNGEQSTKE